MQMTWTYSVLNSCKFIVFQVYFEWSIFLFQIPHSVLNKLGFVSGYLLSLVPSGGERAWYILLLRVLGGWMPTFSHWGKLSNVGGRTWWRCQHFTYPKHRSHNVPNPFFEWGFHNAKAYVVWLPRCVLISIKRFYTIIPCFLSIFHNHQFLRGSSFVDIEKRNAVP